MTANLIRIVHTRRDGTLLEGSRKHDGASELVRPHGFRYFPSLGCLGITRSRDRQAQKWRIDSAAEALRAAGWHVEVEIDEDVRRSFAEAERTEQAEARAERFAGYADNAASRSQSLSDQAHGMASRIPFGQPVLVGHHSERADRRSRERISSAQDKSFAEAGKASHWADRERATASYETFRKSPRLTLRRIERLEADLRRVKKWRKGKSAGRFERDIANPETVTELDRRYLELTEEISFWRDIVKKAEANGHKFWGQCDFQKGDFARVRGRWYEVLRSNPKTLTVPRTLDPHNRVITRANCGERLVTHTIPYDEVFGHRSAEEQEAQMAAGDDQPPA
ncbi:DUF3560 domain-containing protein [Streptomyces violascens]|uniref:DUF3560 domain-containing protein n=1 Tax=Streptomyces violascens TaxID=67381 RepID=A0ABQ3QVA3_9ACTN|nr:DUF3560 domain-containing protein [Streptomyces violascens]GGU26497.1 hypothetical protein GCM10010289_54770 [Streptomyces violascens]GHI41214.1 hypothetical protein Sviol_56220 [Streptomyces violascens]